MRPSSANAAPAHVSVAATSDFAFSPQLHLFDIRHDNNLINNASITSTPATSAAMFKGSSSVLLGGVKETDAKILDLDYGLTRSMSPSQAMFHPVHTTPNLYSSLENAWAAMGYPSPRLTYSDLPLINSTTSHNTANTDNGNLLGTPVPRRRRGPSGGPTIHKCPHPGCDKVFDKHPSLKSHIKIHSSDRPFVCSVCDMRFSRNHDLKRYFLCRTPSHMYSSQCIWYFAVRHEKIHSGLRPYACPFCAKTFLRHDALNRHLKVDNGRGCRSRVKKSELASPSPAPTPLKMPAHGLLPAGSGSTQQASAAGPVLGNY